MAIRHNENIKGVQIGDRIHKLNLFADDTVLCISEPLAPLSHLLVDLERFGCVAGFTVNYSKSEAYPINLTKEACEAIRLTFKFKLVKKQWTHLGVIIPHDFGDLFKANFDPLEKCTRERLRDWS